VSAACAGLGGGVLALVLQLAAPGSFQLPLSLYLLAGVVVGGLGSLAGAMWGAALLVLLPGWSNDLGHAFSLSTKVYANLPLAIYGAVLILAMLVWPTGIQGAIRTGASKLRTVLRAQPPQAPSGPADEPPVSVEEPRVAS
jgi:branched-chain amino acid transport system permease protein